MLINTTESNIDPLYLQVDIETCSNENCACCIADSDERLCNSCQNDTNCLTRYVDMSCDCIAGYTGINSGKDRQCKRY